MIGSQQTNMSMNGKELYQLSIREMLTLDRSGGTSAISLGTSQNKLGLSAGRMKF